ncbi:MAG: class I SAM-dependent methyltransferase [Clostridiales bacterium]|jgi:tRNA (adenine22-N1)-methyltransferase|nr:class I SAM-dependent methyltransferase [Clostridiales bacterium]
MVKLSERLQAVLGFVRGKTLADIGADHAYIPIAACQSGLCETAIACDIKPGPLGKAAENIKAYNLESRIQTRLGAGLTPLHTGEADCIVIAGMGGMNIIEILTASLETAKAAKRLVLQPQRDLPKVKAALSAMGFLIEDEKTAREGDRFYPVVAARHREG